MSMLIKEIKIKKMMIKIKKIRMEKIRLLTGDPLEIRKYWLVFNGF